jgi:hypothetical protein
MGIWVTKQCPSCPGPKLENGQLPGASANGRYRTYEAFSGANTSLLRHFVPLLCKPNVCQDRLGTNVGKVERGTCFCRL